MRQGSAPVVPDCPLLGPCGGGLAGPKQQQHIAEAGLIAETSGADVSCGTFLGSSKLNP